MTHTGDQEIGVVSWRLPDNPGELACMQLGLVSLKETLAKPRTQTMTAPRLYYWWLVLSWGKLSAKAWDEVQWHGMIHPYALARVKRIRQQRRSLRCMINKIHYSKN